MSKRRLNWTTIVGLCTVVMCLCAVGAFWLQAWPDIKRELELGDKVDALQESVASISSDSKEHTAQLESARQERKDQAQQIIAMRYDLDAIKRALARDGLMGDSDAAQGAQAVVLSKP